MRYEDANGNSYTVEQASNKQWIVARTNDGGNRKGYKFLGAERSRERMEKNLTEHARQMGWRQA